MVESQPQPLECEDILNIAFDVCQGWNQTQMTNVKTVDHFGSSKGSACSRRFLMAPSQTVRHLTFLAGLLVAMGCGSQSGRERIAVYGTVMMDGKNVEHGSISFLPAEGHTGPAANGAISNGEYRFTADNGPTAGPHRVLVGVAPAKNDSAGGKFPVAKGDAAGRSGGSVKTAGRSGRWEFEIPVSKEDREQDFELE